MRRPSFQFYPSDHGGNAKLKRCSWPAKGAWIGVLCLMHDSDEYGVLRWPLREIAQAIGCPLALLKELVSKQVLKGCESGVCDAYVYTPRSGRKDGEPAVLIQAQPGPIWYCSRMVRDEHVRIRRGEGTRFGDASMAPTDVASNPSPKPPLSDGSSSSSSSSSVKEEQLPTPSGAAAPPDPIFGSGLAFLIGKGVKERSARSFLGLFRKEVGDPLTAAELLERAERDDVSEPLAWLRAAARTRDSTRIPPAVPEATRSLAECGL